MHSQNSSKKIIILTPLVLYLEMLGGNGPLKLASKLSL